MTENLGSEEYETSKRFPKYFDIEDYDSMQDNICINRQTGRQTGRQANRQSAS